MRSAPLPVLAALVLAGCFVDEGPMTAGQETLDPSSSTTAASTTTGPATTTSASTSATSTATTSTATTDSTETTTAGTTTAGPPDCWDLDDADWEATMIEDARLGLDPTDLRLRADGLEVLYLAGDPAQPHLATRASVDEAFVSGAPLPGWSVAEGLSTPAIGAAGDEVFFAYDPLEDELASDVGVAVLEGAQWSATKLLDGLNSERIERNPTLTEDGARMIFSRDSGPVNPYLGTPTIRFFEATRPGDAPPGEGFGAPALVELPGITDDAYAHVLLCPMLSPDGLHLFYASTSPMVVDEGNAGDSLAVQVTQRVALDAPWGPPTRLDALNEPGWQPCPMSITRDGCQMIVQRFKFPPDPEETDPVRPVLLRRGPP
jgi:hypothetical protein